MTYEILRVIWWVLLGVLLTGFAISDGFDLGAAALLPWVGRNDLEKRVVLNTLGPVWESNQVWLILGGGAIFAAWPLVYAVSFSGLYLAMLLVLACLILRPAAFKYRSKLTSSRWRNSWDIILTLSGALPAILFGVAVGNTLLGIPFQFDDSMRISYLGSFFGLLHPFAILCGLVSFTMLLTQGALYLAIKTEFPIRHRALALVPCTGLTTILLFAIGGYWVGWHLDGYVLQSAVDPLAASNPLAKQVALKTGSWLNNFRHYHWLEVAPVLGFVGTLLAIGLRKLGKSKLAFTANSLAIAGIIGTVGFSMFPFILPSSQDPNMSLTVWDASSSETTLFLMLIATIIFLPIILLYIRWVYRVMGGKVVVHDIAGNSHDKY